MPDVRIVLHRTRQVEGSHLEAALAHPHPEQPRPSDAP